MAVNFFCYKAWKKWARSLKEKAKAGPTRDRQAQIPTDRITGARSWATPEA